MFPVHQVWPKPSCKAQWKGGRRQGRQRKRWEDSIREWTGLEFGKSQRAVENRGKWRKLVAKSTVMPQRPSWLKDRRDERWWWGYVNLAELPVSRRVDSWLLARRQNASSSHLDMRSKQNHARSNSQFNLQSPKVLYRCFRKQHGHVLCLSSSSSSSIL